LILGGGVQHWLTPSVGPSVEEGVHTISTTVLTLITLVVVVLGVAGAWVATRRNLYADAFNETVLMRPGQWLVRGLVYFDNRGVDGVVNSLAAGLGGGSGRLRRIQTGFVRSYALSMLAGAAMVLAVLLGVRFS